MKIKLESEYKVKINEKTLQELSNYEKLKDLLTSAAKAINAELQFLKFYKTEKEELYFDTKDRRLKASFISLRLDTVSRILTAKVRIFSNGALKESVEYSSRLTHQEAEQVLARPSAVLDFLARELRQAILQRARPEELVIASKITTSPRNAVQLALRTSKQKVLLELLLDRKILHDYISGTTRRFCMLELEHLKGSKRLFCEFVLEFLRHVR